MSNQENIIDNLKLIVRYIFIFYFIDNMNKEIENIKKMIEDLAKKQSEGFEKVNKRLDAIQEELKKERQIREKNDELLNNRITKLRDALLACFKEIISKMENEWKNI